VVTSLIVHEGDDETNANGYWREYEGGITDWKAQVERAAKTVKVANIKTAASPAAKAAAAATPKAPSKKLSFKDKQLLEKLPAEIAALELEQADIHSKLSKAGGYNNDVGALQAAMKRMTEIEDALDTKLTQWAELEG
jgi:ATP-binding cassette subfamily F protein uup